MYLDLYRVPSVCGVMCDVMWCYEQEIKIKYVAIRRCYTDFVVKVLDW